MSNQCRIRNAVLIGVLLHPALRRFTDWCPVIFSGNSQFFHSATSAAVSSGRTFLIIFAAFVTCHHVCSSLFFGANSQLGQLFEHSGFLIVVTELQCVVIPLKQNICEIGLSLLKSYEVNCLSGAGNLTTWLRTRLLFVMLDYWQGIAKRVYAVRTCNRYCTCACGSILRGVKNHTTRNSAISLFIGRFLLPPCFECVGRK